LAVEAAAASNEEVAKEPKKLLYFVRTFYLINVTPSDVFKKISKKLETPRYHSSESPHALLMTTFSSGMQTYEDQLILYTLVVYSTYTLHSQKTIPLVLLLLSFALIYHIQTFLAKNCVWICSKNKKLAERGIKVGLLLIQSSLF